MNLVKNIKLNLSSIPGWRTKRKIVVIESDDWGSIRMPSKEVLDELNLKGLIPENDYYNRYDSLASPDDLSNLFELLSQFKDRYGNSPKITANTIVANPDFDKIMAADYQEYHWELFTETLRKYPVHTNAFELWKEGMHHGLFYPQFHGRDHVNITVWLNKIRQGDAIAKLAFDHKMLGLRDHSRKRDRDFYFMRALDSTNSSDLEVKLEAVQEGLLLFKKVFGYRSKSFIAPSYVWNRDIEQLLAQNGVEYIQGIWLQKIPVFGKEELVNRLHFLGDKNKFNQRYLVRNAFFEPSLGNSKGVVEQTLQRIKLAFRWNKPAIIGSHRINYIGHINEKKRDENLALFKQLLTKIMNYWPEVEFMTSDQLGTFIKK